jgi:ribose transport system substrate-binding protein
MSAEIKKLCPDCGFNVENVNPADAGTKLPGQIVTYLAAHPDVDYIVPAFSDGAIGVPQALEAAGLSDRVKMITQGAGEVPIDQLKQGQVDAFVPEPTQVEGWMMVDALVRHFAGDPVPADAYATVPRQYLTPSNLAEAFGGSDIYNGVKDYQEQYKALWGLGS